MVYIKSIEKEIFPYYLKSKKNELFSSWLCRIAINHKVKPQTFILNYFGRGYPIWNRDIDMLAPSFLIDKVAKHTPMKRVDIINMFLCSYESYVFESVAKKGGATENILPIGINHRKRKRFGLQFCNRCLGKEEPYYRKEWRLSTSIICVSCNVYLQDRCKNCNSPVTFHRINLSNNVSIMEFKSLKICSHCNVDLSKQDGGRKPSSIEIEYQKHIDDTIEKGYNNLTNYSFNYIRTLLILTKKIRYDSKNNRFRRAVIEEFNKSFFISKQRFKYWNVNERISILPFSYLLLKDMKGLRKIIENHKVGRSYLNQENTLPFWFLNEIYY